MAIDAVTLALANQYTEDSLLGAGALKGKDGFSPLISSKETEGGTEVSITDETHTETFVIKDGIGIPTGGTAGQVLTKSGDGNYETEWKDLADGGETGTVKILKCVL